MGGGGMRRASCSEDNFSQARELNNDLGVKKKKRRACHRKIGNPKGNFLSPERERKSG